MVVLLLYRKGNSSPPMTTGDTTPQHMEMTTMASYTIDGTTYDTAADVADAFGMSDYSADDLAQVAAMDWDELVADCNRVRSEYGQSRLGKIEAADEIAAAAIEEYLSGVDIRA